MSITMEIIKDTGEQPGKEMQGMVVEWNFLSLSGPITLLMSLHFSDPFTAYQTSWWVHACV